ncbi:MAG TPA: LamG-like jellyroll fold domain-containing protein [Ignavibacteriaceae bacterium]|nr:LamG-like jellyroll fold domain-containing protein [Ignavibacteriaceae bacterium]
MKHFLLIFLTGSILLYGSFDPVSAQNKGARWQFENNGNDSAGWDQNNNNGIVSGSAFYSNSAPLIEGDYYLSLEDSANFGVFRTGDDPELDFSNERIALSLWVYPVQGYDNPQFLLIKGNRSGNIKTNNYSLRLNNGILEFLVHDSIGTPFTAASSFSVPNDQWTYLAVYYDYNNSIVYLWNESSSAPTDTIGFTAGLLPDNDSLYIGTSGKNGLKRFWGRIDDVRLGSTYEQIQGTGTSIKDLNNDVLNKQYILYQNYPNPFNATTTISFNLQTQGTVCIDIYNMLGEKISNLINRELSAGNHLYGFNASGLPSGIYFYKITYQDKSETKSMLLLK